MSRTIKEIYQEAIKERNKRLELSEFSSDSKLSIMNGLTWVFAAIIHSFEALLDVFAIDISNAINERINGTPNYYANALLQYQKGDTLMVREDGLAFGYESVDPSKQIVTQVSYVESTDDTNLDSKLILKVATGEKGKLREIEAEDVVLLNTYINKIKFAGTRIEVISRKGDILVPMVTVFHDGAVPESEILDGLEDALNEYMMKIDFDAIIYTSQVLDAMKKVDHVKDVYIDTTPGLYPYQGIYLYWYGENDFAYEFSKIERFSYTSSGYVRESTGEGIEEEMPTFRQAITLKIDSK